MISNTPWNKEDLDAYVVWCRIGTGEKIYFMNSWLNALDAIRERDSLNELDNVGHYYVTYMGVIL